MGRASKGYIIYAPIKHCIVSLSLYTVS